MISENLKRFNVFIFQQRVMPILLGWGIISTLLGLLFLLVPGDWWRGFGSMFIAWGVIDALIALVGKRGGARNLGKLEANQMTWEEHDRQALRFEQIVWANAFLDVIYIAGGLWVIGSYSVDPLRSGWGWGILIQALFLLGWDVWLAWSTHQKRHERAV